MERKKLVRIILGKSRLMELNDLFEIPLFFFSEGKTITFCFN